MRGILFATVSIAAVLAAGAAHAQAGPQTSPAQTPPAQTPPAESEPGSSADATAGTSPQAGSGSDVDTSGQLDEIVVTAQRVAQNLQRAAVAVDVVQGSELVQGGITDVGRLGNLVPALTVEPSSTGNLIFLRGVGNFTLVPTSDPAVAFNYDGVYIGRPTSTSTSFFDLARIEVLKGPQGTLYGRNATGGAINVIPVRPKLGETSGYAVASYARYDDITAEGAINLPLSDTFAFRFSAGGTRRDGYLRDGTSDDENYALRAQLLGELTPQLTVRLSADYSDQGGAGVGVSYLGRYRFAGPALGNVFVPSNLPRSEGTYTDAAQAFRLTGSTGPAGRRPNPLAPFPFRDNRFFGAHAEIQYEADFGTFTIIPAFRHSRLNYLSNAAAFIARTRESDDQLSLEARLTGKPIGIFDYTVGGFFYDEMNDARSGIFVEALASIFRDKLRTTSFAPFARVTANLTDSLRLVGGVRYTRDRKEFTENGVAGTIICQIATPTGPSCPNAPLFTFVDNFSQLPFRFPSATQVPPVLPIGGGAIVARTNRQQNNKLTNERVTYRAAAEFDVAPRSLLYASVETGFRSGGFSGAAGFETYEPEYITAYTVGSKNRFFANRLQVNLEGFYWDYTNQQVNFVGLDVNGRTANLTTNLGSSTIKGAEVETQLLVTPTTLVSANVQYLDTEQKNFIYQTPVAGGPPITGCAVSPSGTAGLVNVDCSGFPAFNSPKWTVNLAAQQTFAFGGYNLIVGADTQYRTKRYIAFQYLPEQLEGSVWRSNAQVSFGPDDERWSIVGFVRNIENNRTPTFETLAPVTNFLVATTAAPRIYGVRGSVRF